MRHPENGESVVDEDQIHAFDIEPRRPVMHILKQIITCEA